MTRILNKAEFDAIPLGNSFQKRSSGPKPYDCPHFGGNCMGDGCINWTPVGSAVPLVQSAHCLLERGGEPVHRAECERKAKAAIAQKAHYEDYASRHDAPRAIVNAAIYHNIAHAWLFLRKFAPVRQPDGSFQCQA